MLKRALLFSLLMLLLVACNAGGDEPLPTLQPTAVPPTTSATQDTPAELIHIRLPMGFIPDPQYAPYYVAVDKGYYAQEGLEVEFDYSFETDGVALVGANELQFAIVGGEQVLLARAQGLPVVYVLEWFQKYPIAVITRGDAGLDEPEDLVGHTVGLPGFFGATYVGFVGLLSANDLTLADVEASEIGFNQVEVFVNGQADAVVGYANNEPLQLAALGEDINVIRVSDYIDLVANGIITNEETIANRPELVEGFVRATLRGLADTLANPDEAYEISKKFVEGLDDSRKNVLEASLEMWRSEPLGVTDPVSWEQTQNVLLEMGFLDAPLDNLEAAYTNEFVLKVQP
ncbi:MAG: myristoyl transferase [Chloroflexi bacterium]|nr:MAG: myristoyl transferase [Chloroflexota bacterium]